MSKLSKISKRLALKQKLAHNKNEGLLRVSFVFDGRTYAFDHLFNANEIAHMKELCKDHGEVAGTQLIWRGAVRHAGTIAENAMAAAGFEYVQRHHKGNASGNFKAELEREAAKAGIVTYADVVAAEDSDEFPDDYEVN